MAETTEKKPTAAQRALVQDVWDYWRERFPQSRSSEAVRPSRALGWRMLELAGQLAQQLRSSRQPQARDLQCLIRGVEKRQSEYQQAVDLGDRPPFDPRIWASPDALFRPFNGEEDRRNEAFGAMIELGHAAMMRDLRQREREARAMEAGEPLDLEGWRRQFAKYIAKPISGQRDFWLPVAARMDRPAAEDEEARIEFECPVCGKKAWGFDGQPSCLVCVAEGRADWEEEEGAKGQRDKGAEGQRG